MQIEGLRRRIQGSFETKLTSGNATTIAVEGSRYRPSAAPQSLRP